ncbi:jg15437 [Pararge aegeria aegeria]|uniref:Jg15437 protein n=1 Tax=Pararge aegeria aegeria TaxID=348720 RepID=A0A8S4SAV7_9NEOP|nr:jg15437 [Pararge aegeria aegeria]
MPLGPAMDYLSGATRTDSLCAVVAHRRLSVPHPPPPTTAITNTSELGSDKWQTLQLGDAFRSSNGLSLWRNGVTDSPLCRACMEKNETPTHVMLECTGVTEQREIYLGSPATIPQILSNLGGMLGFWNELGWLE